MSKGITFDNSSGAKQNISYSGTDILPIISAYNGAAKTLGYISTCSYSVHTNFSPVNTCGHFNPISFTRGTRLIAGSFVSIVFDKTPLYELNTTAYNTYNSPTSGHLPPFDIILIFHNEYQEYKESILKIFGVRIMDEGQVHSVDDIYTENTMSFVAEDIQLLSDNGYTKTSPDIDSSYFKQQNVDYKFSSTTKYATDRTYIGIAQGFNANTENYTKNNIITTNKELNENTIKAEIENINEEEKLAKSKEILSKIINEGNILQEMEILKLKDEYAKLLQELEDKYRDINSKNIQNEINELRKSYNVINNPNFKKTKELINEEERKRLLKQQTEQNLGIGDFPINNNNLG